MTTGTDFNAQRVFWVLTRESEEVIPPLRVIVVTPNYGSHENIEIIEVPFSIGSSPGQE